ncbi:iron complex transport system ATP-binding protein [Methylosinus sp. sav-2]|uniref:ABC transporter ATP-binding protein n=1 Tax=Methylosinus sp. sav-2 TaxID=2485168 RepID=UPI0005669725|nr:ABC transporter ATP-binding protein [Methylosinus sp. sav-2]TDX62518.1 iron complex transport system ATP-binding protein [Methylosinus sp. sav-2]
MSEPAISLTNLGYFYRPNQWVLRHCDTRVARGSVFALLGPNGRGKTTLLHLLIGALKPCEGGLSVNGRIAFVPQLFEVTFDYTALDMALMGRARKIGLFSQPSRDDEEAALAALDRFGMADYAQRPFGELSGGQRQLIIFARVLVAEADILVLDEPTSALDLENQSLVLERISSLARNDRLTIVMTTHHPHHALAVADDALLMRGQGDYLFGRAREILTEDNLCSLYRAPLKRIAFEHEGREIETIAPILTPTQMARHHSQETIGAE